MRGLTLTLCSFSIFAAAVSGYLYFLIGTRKAELAEQVVQLESSLSLAKARGLEGVAERENLSRQIADLDRQLNELKARNVSLEARNSQLARDVMQLREEITAREAADKGAAQETADLRRQLVEAKAALASAAAASSNEMIAAYEARIADLEGEVAYLRQSGGGRSLAEALARVPATLQGTVLEVGPKASFVVLNIGTRNGAVPSLEMVLRRGSTIIARVRLTDVRDSYSVAHVLPSSGSGNIRAGDSATRS